YTRAFGDGPRNFEARSSDEGDTRAGPSLLTTTLPLGGGLSFSTDLTCIDSLHGGSFVALSSNSWHANHDPVP
ncbi:hypothetical protein TNCV_5109151, partial [Trichonephila clavipes]